MQPPTPAFVSSSNLASRRPGGEYFFSEKLPIGLSLIGIKESGDKLNIAIPSFDEEGLAISFINFKGDLQIAIGDGQRQTEQLNPGLGLLSPAGKTLHFSSGSPSIFAAVILYIPREWINDFMKDNANLKKIEMVLASEEGGIVCRLGRRQLSMLSSIMSSIMGSDTGSVTGSNLTSNRLNSSNLLEVQNHAMSLLEYFLCNRHKNLLGPNALTSIDNEDDLSLIREVESYISEYYCSDTFTVDSILKKTYTSYHKLNFLFKSMHGMTISEYIRNKRIERSKEMIADNAKSISQIAYEIGYSSISNYILAFKKIYQITPGKYKKQMEA
jgi:AraC-like DNA-binding protein